MAMYKKNKVNKVFVRLSDSQLHFVDSLALSLGLNRSEIIRIIIDSYKGAERVENK